MALSRNQYIDLPVLTYLDIAVVAACVLLVAGGPVRDARQDPADPEPATRTWAS